MPTFANALRVLREARGLTQERLAALTGLRQSAISNLETGRRQFPEISTLLKLAKALGASIDEMLAGIDEEYDALAAPPMIDAHAIEAYHETRMDVVRAVSRLVRQGRRPDDLTFTRDAEALTDQIRRARVPDWENRPRRVLEDDDGSPYAVPVLGEGDLPPAENGSTDAASPVGLLLLPRSLRTLKAYAVRVSSDWLEPRYMRGTTLLISRSAMLRPWSDAYVSLMSGTVVLGRVGRDGARIVLAPASRGAERVLVSPAEIASMHPVIATFDVDVAMDAPTGEPRDESARLTAVSGDTLALHSLLMGLLDPTSSNRP